MPRDLACAFCGQAVETAGVDPCALVVISRWRGPEQDQHEQQFWVHADCLRQRLHPEVAPHADVLDVDWNGSDD